MPDSPDLKAGWIEGELRRQFRPVAAPADLWDRVNRPVTPGRPRQPIRPTWFLPVFASMLVLLTAGLLWGIRQSRVNLREIAPFTDQELRAFAVSSLGESYPSDDPIQIRDWVKSRANIDIELPSSRSEAIHLLGAKLVKLRGSVIAAVAYSVGGDSATLLVSGKPSCCNVNSGSKHLISRANTIAGASLASWNMRDQEYTIAWAGSGDSQGGCRLCHADASRRL